MLRLNFFWGLWLTKAGFAIYNGGLAAGGEGTDGFGDTGAGAAVVAGLVGV